MECAGIGGPATLLCKMQLRKRTTPAVNIALVAAILLGATGWLVAAASGASKIEAPLYVRVDGNHLVNGAGRTIKLLGVDRSGAEYMCVAGGQVFDGPSDSASVAAMASWHINAVRVPLNEDCWLGINGVATGGSTYQSAIFSYVRTLQSFGLYVILDLHWAAPGVHVAASQWPMADESHAPAFWKSVATIFKGNHGVIFDLFNEPYITSWGCWLHGCTASYKDNGSSVTYTTAGMQQLVDAVRATGSTAPIMLGGLGWAGNESQWLKYEPRDARHQLIVSFHNYNFGGCTSVACWNQVVAPLAKVVPVVTGEFGENGCKDVYAIKYMDWADAHGISYLGWTWDSVRAGGWSCGGGPALITNYNGTPTAYGRGLREHLEKLWKEGDATSS